MKRSFLLLLIGLFIAFGAACGDPDDENQTNAVADGDGDHDHDGDGDVDGDGEPGDTDGDGEPGDTDGDPDADGDTDGDPDLDNADLDLGLVIYLELNDGYIWNNARCVCDLESFEEEEYTSTEECQEAELFDRDGLTGVESCVDGVVAQMDPAPQAVHDFNACAIPALEGMEQCYDHLDENDMCSEASFDAYMACDAAQFGNYIDCFDILRGDQDASDWYTDFYDQHYVCVAPLFDDNGE